MTNMRILFIGLCCLVAITGCQKDSTGPPNKTAAQLTADGWSAFSGADYQSALTNFNNALGEDGNYVDAYNGAGWANAKLNAPSSAVSNFTNGLTKDTNAPDSLSLEMNAGLAFASNAQKNYSQSITSALSVLGSNANWAFVHHSAINAAELHLLLAEYYFAQSSPDYVSSLHQVQIIDPAFTADVSTVAGQTALAGEIEQLRSII